MSTRSARAFIAAALVAMIPFATAWADDAQKTAPKPAPKPAPVWTGQSQVGAVCPAETVKANIDKVVHEIPWTKSLAEAKQRAAAEHKLVFWMHALGDLDGLT